MAEIENFGNTRWEKFLTVLRLRTDYKVKPVGLAWRSSTVFIIATIAVGLFTDLFLYGLVVPVLPFMLKDRLGLPPEQIQSHVSGLLASFAIASVTASPFAGVVADKVSTRQAPFLLGLAALLGATVLLFVGKTIHVLVIARILQGVSGGVVWTVGLALCLETVGPENLGKTIGSIFGVISAGTFAAPIIGGVLYEKTGYKGVFGIAAATLVIDFFMRLMIIEKKQALKYEVDALNIVSDVSTTDRDRPEPSTQDPESHQANGDASEQQPLLGSKRLDLDQFKLGSMENRNLIVRLAPIIPCLAHPGLLTALLLGFTQSVLLGSFDATVPIVAEDYFGFSSLKAGLLFLPLGIFDLILGPVFGWLVDRYGTKPVAVFSYGLLVPVLVCLRIPHPGGLRQIVIYSVLLCFCGIGIAGIGAPTIVEAGTIVQKYHEANPEIFGANGPYAQLYGLSNTIFAAGLAVGPELAGELKQAIGYGNMNSVLAGICSVVCMLCWMFIGGRPKLLPKRSE